MKSTTSTTEVAEKSPDFVITVQQEIARYPIGKGGLNLILASFEAIGEHVSEAIRKDDTAHIHYQFGPEGEQPIEVTVTVPPAPYEFTK